MGATSCIDWSDGQAAGGLAIYSIGNDLGPNHARAVLSCATATSRDLSAGQEYYAFTLNLTHNKTVGTGACVGCLEPAVIFLSAMNIVPGTNPWIRLTTGANFSGSRWVSWQNGYPVNIQQRCAFGGGFFCHNPTAYFDVVPYSVTPTRSSTWGQVKSLYR